MTGTKMRFMLAAATLAMLGACGNVDSEEGSIPGMLAEAARQTVGQRDRDEVTEKVDPSEMAATALRVNKGPLILVGLESKNTTQVLALVGQNAGQRTYMTANEQGLILRDGMLAGTRGLGDDLSVAEMAQSSALIRSGQGGQARRVMRYWTGDGLESPLTLDCTVGRGPKPGVMIESCRKGALEFQNNYLVQGGRITVSRQWIGPDLGYVTIQELRP
ncbi:MAG TPA: YjbF family lipoprotein [Paracoccus sp. (in: a-proteobacteria)]|uniref:YjbF family lipoprotein n=1 Tax=Paracoccus sp. TaxID=267 RepID=UPI002C7C8F8A|nr:YjbF family lipoprotein [Paracoccus sp. (in: a-proteobacteria)]HWL57375.1 YjbF family lipoprotein [Paracoccus sp. (in: a-proteobacteria)]